jgi:hypothetical protein
MTCQQQNGEKVERFSDFKKWIAVDVRAKTQTRGRGARKREPRVPGYALGRAG